MNNIDKVKTTAKNTLENQSNALKDSASDWLHYIQQHPAQTVIFASVAFYALKGFLCSFSK